MSTPLMMERGEKTGKRNVSVALYVIQYNWNFVLIGLFCSLFHVPSRHLCREYILALANTLCIRSMMTYKMVFLE